MSKASDLLPFGLFRHPFREEYNVALEKLEANMNRLGEGETVNRLTEEIMLFLSKMVIEHQYGPVLLATSSAVYALSNRVADALERIEKADLREYKANTSA